MDNTKQDRRRSRRISFVPVNVNNTEDVLRDSSVIEREREELKQRREREKRVSQKSLPLPQSNENRSSRILEMYANIIRMSNENKINQKNTWNLDLISHMEDVIMDGSDSVETNFQKASTTLDASVKIYGYRVDDTLNTGYRILESLSTGEQSKQQQTEAPKQSKKLGVVNTIDTNLHSIQMDSSEMTYDADPLFHVMSRKFDEGGVKGLLLANLGVTHGWNVVFDSNDVIEIEEAPTREEIPDTNKYVDVRGVFKKRMEKGDMEEQLKQPVCKSLLTLIDEIRTYEKDCEDLDENYENDVPEREEEEISVLEDQNVELDEEVKPIPIATHPVEEDWGMYDNDMGGGDMEVATDTMNSNIPSFDTTQQQLERSNTIEQLITRSQTTDYSYFQPSLLIKSWAGPSFWKISKAPLEKKKVQKETTKGKKKQIITFAEEPVINPAQAFPAVKRKTDLVMSDSQYSSQRNPVLPNDFHYSFNNLIHLNCRKDVELRRIVNFNVNTSERRDLNEWELDPTNIDVGGCTLENPMDIMNDSNNEKVEEEAPVNEDSGGFDNGVVDDGGFDEPSHVGFISEIDESTTKTTSLLKADRVVERISIAYATQATQVDIQELKDDMWKEIQRELKEQAIVSFIQVVKEVKKKQKEDIANQFFFICLLHLANEQTLHLQNQGQDILIERPIIYHCLFEETKR